MANTRQAKKRILVNAKKRLRNLAVRSAVKSAFKKAKAAIDSKNVKDAEPLIKEAVISIDKASCKGIIHKNTAARKKSRLMKHYNGIVAEAAN